MTRARSASACARSRRRARSSSINGRKTFLRGTLECCIFPQTGYPPTDVDVVEAHHPHCQGARAEPHPLPLLVPARRRRSSRPTRWASTTRSRLRRGPTSRRASATASRSTTGSTHEADRILKAYGNHPSFVLMAYGNEPGGPNHAAFLGALGRTTGKAKDPRRLYTSGAGWPEMPENQFHVTPEPRDPGRGARGSTVAHQRASRRRRRPTTATTSARRKVPVISHEIGQWCVYPNFDEIAEVHRRPARRRTSRSSATRSTRNHMGDQARRLPASPRASCRRCATRRRSSPRCARRAWAASSCSTCTTSPARARRWSACSIRSGIEKGYVTPAEFRRFCNSTVPLARLDKRVLAPPARRWTRTSRSPTSGRSRCTMPRIDWQLVDADGGRWRQAARLPRARCDRQWSNRMPAIRQPPGAKCGRAQKLRLVVAVTAIEGTALRERLGRVGLSADSVDTATAARRARACAAGLRRRRRRWTPGARCPACVAARPVRGRLDVGKVRSASPASSGTRPGRAARRRTRWASCATRSIPALRRISRPRATATGSGGTWCTRGGDDPGRPAAATLRPIVQVIDDWFTNRRLAWSSRPGSGRASCSCAASTSSRSRRNPVARQMRHSLLRYAASDHFAPGVELTAAAIRALVTP